MRFRKNMTNSVCLLQFSLILYVYINNSVVVCIVLW